MTRKLGAVIGFAVAAAMAAVPAHAIPMFSSGSFSYGVTTTTKSRVITTASFTLKPKDMSGLGSGTGSFVGYAFPASLALPNTNPLIFTTLGAGTFDWSNAALGSFVGIVVTPLGIGCFLSTCFAAYGVDGSFTLGSSWQNSGTIVPASETWSMTQTGGVKRAISMSGTFFAEARQNNSVPEPATLTLFGAGLAAFGARRRRTAKA